MKYLGPLMLVFATIFSSCSKEESSLEKSTGTVFYNPSSSTACSYNIQLTGGRKIYPVNFEKIEDHLENGKQVTVSFRSTNDYVSPCSDAQSVILEDIR